jgi:hypothetical protein
MRREVIFYMEAKKNQPNPEFKNHETFQRMVASYAHRIKALADSLSIDGFPDVIVPTNRLEINDWDSRDVFYQIDNFLSDIYARNFFEIEKNYEFDFIKLDVSWKEKVSSYIVNIRKHVQDAEIEEGLRERILKKLGDLQLEIDRNRTRVSAASDVLVTMTEAIGKSAENLRPAVRLLERITGSLSRLKRAEADNDQPRLPPPDEYGLEDGCSTN